MERGCRNCMWLYHMVTYNPTAPCSECLDYDKWQTAKRTNADRIRSMTDEELAEWIAEYTDCLCGIHKPGCSKTKGTCVATWLDWLKQEVDDGNHDH